MDKSSDTGSVNDGNNGDEFNIYDELRDLLVGPERSQIAKIEEKVYKLDKEKLSEALPDLVVLSSNQDDRLNKALSPVVEDAISLSVKRNPKPIADAIFPVIGPAIRKAIFQALNQLNQSMNKTLEHSLNVGWRLEALKTGKPFSEVVLSHSLLYRVEQIFLIHRETGLLLEHVALDNLETQDGDLVSGMLSAIQDFVKDSFKVESDDALESFEVGELTVWVEQGPHALVAAVIRGNPPLELRNSFKGALESIHLEYTGYLDPFNGDTSDFERSSDILELCLVTQSQKKAKKSSPLFLILLGVILLCIGSWLFFKIRSNMRWTDYIDKLRLAPGVVVTDFGKRNGKFYVDGLQDPVATDPNEILKNTKLNPKNITANWEPYLSFNPELSLKRAIKTLGPPATIDLKIENGVLVANGSSSKSWLNSAQDKSSYLPGITQTNLSGVVIDELQQVDLLKKSIESTVIRFDSGRFGIADGQQKVLDSLALDIKEFNDLLNLIGKNYNIEIAGHTDNSGSQFKNNKLSIDRASYVRSQLRERGVVQNLFLVGKGSSEPVSSEKSEEGKKLNRRVTLNIISR